MPQRSEHPPVVTTDADHTPVLRLLPVRAGQWAFWVDGAHTTGHQTVEGLPSAVADIVHAATRRWRTHTRTVYAPTPDCRLVEAQIPAADISEGWLTLTLRALAGWSAEHPDDAARVLGADLRFLIDLYLFAEDLVSSGRISFTCTPIDREWMMRWCYLPGSPQDAILDHFALYCPAVFRVNTTIPPADLLAATLDILIHDRAYDILEPLRTVAMRYPQTLTSPEPIRARPYLEHLGPLDEDAPYTPAEDLLIPPVLLSVPILASLVTGQPTPHFSAEPARKLNQWREEQAGPRVRFSFLLSEPHDVVLADAGSVDVDPDFPDDSPAAGLAASGAGASAAATMDSVRWRVALAMSEGTGPFRPVTASDIDDTLRPLVHDLLRTVSRVVPDLRDPATALGDTLARSSASNSFLPAHLARLLGTEETTSADLAMLISSAQLGTLLSHGVRDLRKAGIHVLVPRAWTRHTAQARLEVAPAERTGPSRFGMDTILDFRWDISVGDRALSDAERLAILEESSSIVSVNGSFIFLDDATIAAARRWFHTLTAAALADGDPTDTADAADPEDPATSGADAAALAAARARILSGDAGVGGITLKEFLAAYAYGDPASSESGDPTLSDTFQITGSGWLDSLLTGLESADDLDDSLNSLANPSDAYELEAVAVPAAVTTPLRDHQQRGLNWLVGMTTRRVGGILADDMGLGKTLQVLALIAWDAEAAAAAGEEHTATLVVAPTSVLEAWRSEAARHVPTLRVHVEHGSQRTNPEEFPEIAATHDLVITSYGTITRRLEAFAGVEWGRVVADEAQNIKNYNTKNARALRALRAQHRLAVTGTPVENSLSDLFSLMDFANPGILGSMKSFLRRLAIPIERDQDDDARQRLRGIIRPLILRRIKTDDAVGLNLPNKHEHVEMLPLTSEQAGLYQAYTTHLKELLAQRESSPSSLILASLTKIKQICNHPAHFTGDGSGLLKNGRHRSKKVERLFELVEQALRRRRKVLIFTQFPTFGLRLAETLSQHYHIEVPILHGGVSRSARTEMVEAFQEPDGPPVMILSVRAGGTGITLTNASIVIHFDRWWNPAVEDQATDRAYRIGQDQEVDVYKFVSTGTIDERIHDIITDKRSLAATVVGSGEGWIAQLGEEELLEMMELRASAAEDDFVDPDHWSEDPAPPRPRDTLRQQRSHTPRSHP